MLTYDEKIALISTFYNFAVAPKTIELVHFYAKHVACFDEIKRGYCAALILDHLNLDAHFMLYTVASKLPSA